MLAEEIARLVGYAGEIRWDISKPDGQMVKIFETKKLSELGLSCSTPLVKGLQKAINWFSLNYKNSGDGLRL